MLLHLGACRPNCYRHALRNISAPRFRLNRISCCEWTNGPGATKGPQTGAKEPRTREARPPPTTEPTTADTHHTTHAGRTQHRDPRRTRDRRAKGGPTHPQQRRTKTKHPLSVRKWFLTKAARGIKNSVLKSVLILRE